MAADQGELRSGAVAGGQGASAPWDRAAGQRRSRRQAVLDRAESRRLQILEAASQCFRRHGFHSASMAQVSKAARMSAGHIYHYFESKEDIIRAIVQMDLEDTLRIMNEAEAGGGDLIQAMLAGVGQGVERMTDPAKAAMALEVMAEAARNPRVAEMVRQADQAIRNRLRGLLLSSHRGREFMADGDLDGKVEVMASLFGGLSLRILSHPGWTEPR